MATVEIVARIVEYNAAFQSHIIFDCPCGNYRYFKDLRACILNDNTSYVCCILIEIGASGIKTIHKILPVMLGSDIDISIRGHHKDEIMLHGTYIIDGILQTVPIFLTNNLGIGHVYRNKKTDPVFKLSLYDKIIGNTLKLTYNDVTKKSDAIILNEVFGNDVKEQKDRHKYTLSVIFQDSDDTLEYRDAEDEILALRNSELNLKLVPINRSKYKYKISLTEDE